MNYVGIDIGSTNAKIVVIDEKKNILFTKVIKTGFNSRIAADNLINELVIQGYKKNNMKIIATGYGRVSVPEASKTVTEITCHSKGAVQIFGCDNLVIIDIGGQDTKIIDVTNCEVTDFLMNDKCSAGTGRFLDVMAKTMDTDITSLVEMASQGGGVTISSLCTVFAESEIISLIGKSEKKENIANAIVKSIITKIISQLSKISYKNKKICLTGGLSNMRLFVDMMSQMIGQKVEGNEFGNFAGAYGAAIIAIS